LNPVDALLAGTSVFFALNLGGSGMAPAFSVALGANIVRRRTAALLFAACVFAGALLLGRFVAKTLGSGLVPPSTFDHRTALCVIGGAAAALFAANIIGVPQSTIWVTVFAIVTVGLDRGNLKTDVLFYRLIPAWVGLPLLSFLLTRGVVHLFYPLRGWNFRFYEHMVKHEWKLRAIVVGSSCYVALAIGSSNVANVVAPLATAGVLNMATGFLLISPLFGVGGAIFGGPARTVGREIVPIGLFTAAICNVVVGSIILLAARFGIPQSLVQVNAAAVMAVAHAKDGLDQVLGHGVIRKIAVAWLVTPFLASAITLVMLRVLT
jgi:sulfate permease